MDSINFSENILRLRQMKQITQEQLANFVGVTKASVSKWENGQSMPDVVLLPRLAAYFDITIDELIGYESQLSAEECLKIYEDMCKAFVKDGFDVTYMRCKRLVKQYYSCYTFLEKIVVLWLNHWMITTPEKGQEVLREAKDLCQHILENCNDIKLCNDVMISKAMINIHLGDYHGVISEIEDICDPTRYAIVGENVLAMAYQYAGDSEKAADYVQICTYNHLIAILGMAQMDMAIHANDLKRCEETFRRIKDLDKSNNLEYINLNGVFLVYFQMVKVYCLHDKRKEALDIFKEYVEKWFPILQSDNLQVKGDEYFYSYEKWFAKVGGTTPRDLQYVRESMLSIFEMPELACLQEEKEFIKLKKTAYKMLG